ncbi:hypothetical protein ACI78Q_06025 [Geodermatophilus sp. SYSU D00705]
MTYTPTPEPLPPVQFDPAFQRALELRQGYDETVADIRADQTASELTMAQEIAQVLSFANTELVTAYKDLMARRQARKEHLQGFLPVGPALDEDQSPADRAVIQSLFRAALAEARSSSDDQLTETLADSQRYGDEVVTRAVLTALVERGRIDIVKSRWADAAGLADAIDEAAELLDGWGPWSLAVRNAFAPLPKPQEVERLPDLQAQAVAEVQRFNQSRGPAQRARALPPLVGL